MEGNPVKKCRVCLKNSVKTYPLTKTAIGIKNQSTYGQLLQECARLELSADYEHFLPQNICNMCCQELRNAYNFIQQAQYCNNKLINLLSKRLEKVIVKKENDVGFGEHFENRYKRTCDNILQNPTGNEFRIVNAATFLMPIELEAPKETTEPILDEKREINVAVRQNTTSENKLSTCPICKKAIINDKSLITHMRIQHGIEAPVKYLKQPETVTITFVKKTLNTKPRETVTKKLVKKAFKIKPKERVFKCSSCNYIAKTYGAIDFHKRSKHGIGEEKFKCNFCPFTAWQKYKLFLHVKKLHKENIRALKSCANGNNAENSEPLANSIKADENNEVLDENETTSHGDKTSVVQNIPSVPYENNSDDVDDEKDASDDESFIRDILCVQKRHYQHTSSRLLPRRCDECGNIYDNLQSLKTHKKNVHISEDQYCVCSHCGKKFKRKLNLRKHIERMHNPNIKRVRKKRTKQTKEKRFMCSQCSYACYTQSLLTVHENRHHTGKKPYKCDLCEASFVVSYDLKVHRYKHTGEKPYKCLVCSKCFRVSVDLVKHTRVHTKERPYKCKECDKTFTQSYNLTLHKRTHLKEKNIKCSVCNKYFEDQSLLNVHRTKEDHYEEVK